MQKPGLWRMCFGDGMSSSRLLEASGGTKVVPRASRGGGLSCGTPWFTGCCTPVLSALFLSPEFGSGLYACPLARPGSPTFQVVL